MSIFLKYYNKPWFFKQWETPQVQKVKKAVLRISKNNRCDEVVEQLKNGKIRTKKYLEIVINIMGDYS